MDKSRSAGTKVKASVQVSKTTDGLDTDHTHTASEGASQNGPVLNAKRETKQREPSKHRIGDIENVMPVASRRPLANVDSFGVSRLLGSNGKSCHADDLKTSLSNGGMSLPSMEQQKNAVRPPFRREDTGCTTSAGSTTDSNTSTYKTSDRKAQKHDIRRVDAFVQRHRGTSWRDWLPTPQLRQAGLKQDFDPHAVKRRELAPLRQGDRLTKPARESITNLSSRLPQRHPTSFTSPGPHIDSSRVPVAPVQPYYLLHAQNTRHRDHGKRQGGILDKGHLHADSERPFDRHEVGRHVWQLDLRTWAPETVNVPDAASLEDPEDVLCHPSRSSSLSARYQNVEDRCHHTYRHPSVQPMSGIVRRPERRFSITDLRLDGYPRSTLFNDSELQQLKNLSDALQNFHSDGILWQTKSTARARLAPDVLLGGTKSQHVGYHFDIKPANILISSATEAQNHICEITDFGASKIVTLGSKDWIRHSVAPLTYTDLGASPKSSKRTRQAGEEHQSDMMAKRRPSESPVDPCSDILSLVSAAYNLHGVSLGTKEFAGRPPKALLSMYISAVAYELEGPNSLLIVYYAGHGNPGKDGELTQLILTGSNHHDHPGAKVNGIVRDESEKLISNDKKSDVFLIFDCCNAVRVPRSHPASEDDGPSKICGCEVQACQSNSPGTLHRSYLYQEGPGKLFKINVIYAKQVNH